MTAQPNPQIRAKLPSETADPGPRKLPRGVPAPSLCRVVLIAAWIAFCFSPASRARAAGDSGHNLIGEVIAVLSRSYVEPELIDPERLLLAALQRVSGSYPAVLYHVDESGAGPWIRLQVADQQLPIVRREAANLSALRLALTRIEGFVRAHLPEGGGGTGLDRVQVHLIDGLLSALDAHSRFFTPERYQDFLVDTSGQFAGIGLIVAEEHGLFAVLAVMEDSPADTAGIRAGDRIVEIGHRSVIGMPIEEAVHLLRGEAGKRVRISVLSTGEMEPRRLEIERRNLKFTTVDSHRFRETRGGMIGYIRLRGFQPSTREELRAKLAEFSLDHPRFLGLILDLRSNPGGMLEQAIREADLFLSHGTIVKTVRASGEPLIARARGYGTIHAMPLVVLIDGRSASAAEIVAAALKNNQRAVLIGSRSFGKGTVQTVYPLSDGHGLKLTMAKFYPPGDRSIRWIGVSPHVALHPLRIADGEFALLPAGLGNEPGRERGGFGEDGLPPEAPLATVPFLAGDMQYGKRLGLPLPTDAAQRRPFFARDLALTLARRILDLNGRRGYANLLEKALAVADRESQRQDRSLTRRLAEKGIDWRMIPTNWESDIQVERIDVLADPGGGGSRGPAEGNGQPLRLAVRLRNTGSVALGRVLAVIRSLAGSFDPVQIPIGYLAPGKANEGATSIMLPPQHARRMEPIELVVRTGVRVVARERFFVSVPAGAGASLWADLRFSRPTAAGAAGPHGGRQVLVRASIRNGGRYPSAPAIAVLSSAAQGVTLERTHLSIPSLNAGGLHEVRFTVRFPADPDSGGVPFSFRLIDGTTRRMHLSKEIRLWPGLPPPSIRLFPPVIAVDDIAPVLAQGALKIRGAVTDDREAREIILWVNGRKVFYRAQSREQDTSRLDFTTSSRLDPGYNEMLLVARDEEKLVTRYRFAVWKGPLDGFPVTGPEVISDD